MGTVLFYQLTRSTVADTAAQLLGRAVGQGWPVMVRGPDRAMLEQLDDRLWLGPEDGFLPHGLEGGPQDAEQPVLLGTGPAVNGAKALMLVGGLSVVADEARSVERVWVLFEGGDEAQLQAARAEWKAVAAAGLPAQYWSEDSGKWEKKAESNAA